MMAVCSCCHLQRNGEFYRCDDEHIEPWGRTLANSEECFGGRTKVQRTGYNCSVCGM